MWGFGFPPHPSFSELNIVSLPWLSSLHWTKGSIFTTEYSVSSSPKKSLETTVFHLSRLALLRSYGEPPELHTGLCPAALPSKRDALPKLGWSWGLPVPTSSSEPAGWGLTSRSLLFQASGSLATLSNPLSPKSQLVTCKWEVLQGGAGEPSTVTLETGSPPTRLISTIWENMVSVFSFATAIRVVNLDYRPEWPDYAVKCLFLRDCVERARCHTSSCSFHSSSSWYSTPS